MQRFILLMIVTVTFVVFLAKGDAYGRFGILPGSVGYVWELFGGLALIYVIVEGVRQRFRTIRAAYWLVFGALGISIICGALVNNVESGPIFAGLRTYFRPIPWFFIPVVFAFSETQVRQQLKWLLAICLLQMPIAIEQRMHAFVFGWGGTGDTTSGMLGDSGILSIFLVSAVCIVTALYARKELSLGRYTVLFVLILVPAMINETKVTIFLLPLGLIVSYMFASEPTLRAKRLVSALGFLLLFGAIFVPVYDSLMQARTGDVVTLQDFFTEKEMDRYMSADAEIGSQGVVRRGDSIRVPLQELTKDPVRFAFGYGIGNASDSSFGPGFNGAFNKMWARFSQLSFSKFVLELGMLGTGLVLMLYWLIIQDCRILARQGNGLYSNLAAGWIGVVVVIFVSTFYSLIHLFPALSFLFWYISGLLAAQRMRLVLVSSVPRSQNMLIARA